MNIIGIGPIELVVVLVIAYLVLGPERMTSTVRSLTKVVRDLKEQTAGLPKTLDELLEPTKDADVAKEPTAPGIARPRRTRASKVAEDKDNETSPKEPKAEE